MSRIVLYPGEVVSQTDGDVHFISAGRLIELYRLTPEQRRRVVIGDVRGFRSLPDDISLVPRNDGRYENPEP